MTATTPTSAASPPSTDRCLYVIHCQDDTACGMTEGSPRGGSKKRMAIYSEHKEYQGQTATAGHPSYIKKVAAGPLLTDDGQVMVGSCFIVEATRQEAEAFIHNDPFHKAGVWAQVTINRYISVPNGILRHE